MVCIGLLYLAFEDNILSGLSSTKEAVKGPRGARWIARFLTGVQVRRDPVSQHGRHQILTGSQVGLILLAMLLTRSSAVSLQAKQGLPRGNQVLGWVVLGWLALALGVAEPYGSGLGGKLMLLFYEAKSGKTYAVDAMDAAGSVDPAAYLKRPEEDRSYAGHPASGERVDDELAGLREPGHEGRDRLVRDLGRVAVDVVNECVLASTDVSGERS